VVGHNPWSMAGKLLVAWTLCAFFCAVLYCVHVYNEKVPAATRAVARDCCPLYTDRPTDSVANP
jgi:hypothetical protein